jgi:hypothetical protein
MGINDVLRGGGVSVWDEEDEPESDKVTNTELAIGFAAIVAIGLAMYCVCVAVGKFLGF